MNLALATANLGVHGVTTFTLNLSQCLQAAGHRVTVLTVTRGERWSRLAELGIAGHCIPQQPWESVVGHVKRLASWLAKQAFDLLVVNVGSISSRPFQLCLHLLPDALPVVVLLRNDEPAVYRIAAINCAAWNCAVAVSPKVQHQAVVQLKDKPVHCILNGVELPIAAQLHRRLAWESPLSLLFVGRLTDKQKGIFRLPKIMAACRQQNIPVRLTVIGDGPDRAQLQQLFLEEGLTDRVNHVGIQTNAAVLAQMRAHHLLLMPSNFEGLGTVILEAQANGCVPVSSHLAGVTDAIIMDRYNGRLVDPADILGFVDSIRLFLSPEDWDTYSQASIRYAQQHYSIQMMTARYGALFEELTQGAYPLPSARASLRQPGLAPFRWQDYLWRRVLTNYRRLHSLDALQYKRGRSR